MKQHKQLPDKYNTNMSGSIYKDLLFISVEEQISSVVVWSYLWREIAASLGTLSRMDIPYRINERIRNYEKA